jgi:fucose 4-O-acetylase-like acetyltransferase
MTEVSITEKKRIKYIDIAKGIGILFVIISHSKFNQYHYLTILSNIGWTFHMPLFFILSGLCFRKKGKEITYALLKRLVVPFYFTVLLFIVFYLVTGHIDESKEWIWGGVYGSGVTYSTPFYIKGVGAIWFLLALFWAKIFLNYIVHLPEHLVLVLVALLTYWGVFSYSLFVLPLEIQNGCIGLLYLYIGFLANKYSLLQKIYLPLFVFSLLIWGLGCFNGYGYMTLVNCKVDLISIIVSCCACYVVIIFSKLLERLKLICEFFTWLGKNTIIILCFHMFELYTGISNKIAVMLFSVDNDITTFLVRMIWCLLFALIIPKTPVIRKIFSL